MHSLNDLVASGKVLYLGISDCPAWIVSSANRNVRDHGLRPFVVYQATWNALCAILRERFIDDLIVYYSTLTSTVAQESKQVIISVYKVEFSGLTTSK